MRCEVVAILTKLGVYLEGERVIKESNSIDVVVLWNVEWVTVEDVFERN